MSGKFLNIDDDDLDFAARPKIGAGLKNKTKKPRPRADVEAVAEAGKAHGFDRTTEAAVPAQGQRRGRPPLNQDMTYWRIYVSSDLRHELNQLRDEEGRRLNDVLVDMLAAYRESQT